MDGNFNYKKLLKTERVTYQETTLNLGEFEKSISKFVELTLLFQQSIGEIESPQNELHTFAIFNYAQLPYTVNTICKQIMTGYYLESKILIRHLFETLLQLKYFTKFPDKLLPHINGKRLLISQMAENIFSDKLAYKEYYDFLCKYAHGFSMKGVECYNPVTKAFTVGKTYNHTNCKLSVYLLSDLIFGFINNFDYIYPTNTIESTESGRELKSYVKGWCLSSRDEHIKASGGFLLMHNAIDELIL